MNLSVKLDNPVEFINITPLNPLISKCQIKVCYVSDEPNRNRSVITKDTARKMANSLPGSPIVGFYNEATGDFEEHNRVIDISNGKFEIKDTTKPYGFVDLNAKVWFQKFLDNETMEHEYLMTEGYLWTGQYPECQRIIERGNAQSMELDENYLDATWSKDKNGKPQFFIINEAIISKLCILGENVEPCFEGASITNVQFSFEDGFKEQFFAMINEFKEFMYKGGAKVFTTYAVEIGDALWSALWDHIDKTYPDSNNSWCSIYRIDGIYEENGQKFAILQHRSDMKYYRLNFSLSEESGFVPQEALIEVTKSYTPAVEPQFDPAAVDAYDLDYKAKKEKKDEEDSENEDKTGKEDSSESEESTEDKKAEDDSDEEDDEDKKKKKKFAKEDEEDEEICPKCGKPVSECECEEEDKDEKKAKYNLDDIPEYTELQTNYTDLETKYNKLVETNASLNETIASLTAFKANVEKQEKKALIDSFYMLSDGDKADVIENIDNYSLDDIEAKLSIICVRNKVSFDLDNNTNPQGPTTFNLNGGEDDLTPAWVKAAIAVAKTMND